ncbi:hypothetical protein JW948_10240 [bacterium]|nr:hypothetical protein [bacterium]
MKRFIASLIIGLLGALIVLITGLVQNKKNKWSGEDEAGKAWNRFTMILFFILTGILPLAGMIIGIAGSFFKTKKYQAVFLLFFAIGMFVMYILEKSDFGLLFGILISIFFSIYMNKYTLKSIAVAGLIFIVLALGYNRLILTDYCRNTVPSGWKYPVSGTKY